MEIAERFLRYVAFETTSNDESSSFPSSPKEWDLARFLRDELLGLGLQDVRLDDYGYVFATLPATPGREGDPVIGFLAHMDTSPAVSGANIKPRRFLYEGGDIPLSPTVVTRLEDFPFLADLVGQELIVTDGTTLLGADDKAGIAEIVTAIEEMLAHPEWAHGKIAIGFTPDEEVGRGVEHFDLVAFGAHHAYTVDGAALGELQYETFNAALARLTFRGVNIHPGTAKNKMKNAILLGQRFLDLLPAAETPAHTEGYEGFYHVEEIQGNETEVRIKMIIRDHDKNKFAARKAFVEQSVAYLNGVCGGDWIHLDLSDTYYNMKDKILPVMEIVEAAKAAFLAEGVTPIIQPVRGGTDGSGLSYMGMPCPNLSTGGGNYHGIHEFVSVNAMQTMVRVIERIARGQA